MSGKKRVSKSKLLNEMRGMTFVVFHPFMQYVPVAVIFFSGGEVDEQTGVCAPNFVSLFRDHRGRFNI